MKNEPMRFNGFTFRHNPSRLKIEDAQSVPVILPPFDAPDSIGLGRRPRIIRGEGELCGADCVEQYRALHALYRQGVRGLLTLARMAPMTAYLKELVLTAEPREDILAFSFCFIEARGEACAVSAQPYYTVEASGESLWNVAYRSGTDVDTLVRLNPQIADIADLDAGERVRLC